MTHDELLAKINNFQGYEYDNEGRHSVYYVHILIKQNKALRAVVELHKPRKESLSGDCNECLNYYDCAPYPCATIQAIEKELK